MPITTGDIYLRQDVRFPTRSVRVGGINVAQVIDCTYSFHVNAVPTATIKVRGAPHAAVFYHALVEIDAGFNNVNVPVFTGRVDHVDPDGPDTVIECSGVSRALDINYHEVVKTFTSITNNQACTDLLDDAKVPRYQVNLPAWTIGTVIQPTITFATYGEAIQKVAQPDQGGWYETPDGTIRVAVITPLPASTAWRTYFSMTPVGITETHPAAVTDMTLRPRIRQPRASQEIREVKNRCKVQGAIITQVNADGSTSNVPIVGEAQASSPWVLNPDGTQAYNDELFASELIDTAVKASQVALERVTINNTLRYRATLTIDGDPEMYLARTIGIEDPSYSRLSGRWWVESYTSTISETDFVTTVTSLGGAQAGGAANADPFANFTWAMDREIMGDREYILWTFWAGGSFDFDGEIVSYTWSDNRGVVSGTGVVISGRADASTLTAPWDVTLVVADADGNTGTLTLTVPFAVGDDRMTVPGLHVAGGTHFSSSPDGGRTWNDQAAPGGSTVDAVGALARGGAVIGGAVFGTSLGALYRTTDFCVTAPSLVLAALGSPIVHILADRNNITHIYALTRDGRVYWSQDYGASGSWALFDDLRTVFSLPSIRANRMALPVGNPTGGVWVYAGEGNGLPLIAINPTRQSGQWRKAALGGQLLQAVMTGTVTPQTYQQVIAADVPSAYYRMGETSGQPQDLSGNGLHTTVTVGTPDYAQAGALAGDTNTAIRFVSASSEAFTAPDNALLDPGDTFTIEAWLKKASDGVDMVLVDKGTNGYMLNISTANLLRLAKQNVAQIVSSTVTITADGLYHHVVATKAGATVKLYIDGADVTGAVTNQTIVGTAIVLHIGRAQSASQYVNGMLDEIAIYPTALSAARVLAHYNAGLGSFPAAGAPNIAADPTLFVYEAASREQGELAIILNSASLVPAVFYTSDVHGDGSLWRAALNSPVGKSRGRYIGPDLEQGKFLLQFDDTLTYIADISGDTIAITLATGVLQAGDATNHALFLGDFIGGLAGAYIAAAEGSTDGTIWKTWNRGATWAKLRPATGFPAVPAGYNARMVAISDPANVTLDSLYAGQSPLGSSATYSRTVARLDAVWSGVTQPAEAGQFVIGWYHHFGSAFYRLVDTEEGIGSHMRPPGFGQMQRSTDLITWANVGPTPFTSGNSRWGIINMDRGADGTLWAVAGDYFNGTIAPVLYKSIDEGVTWPTVLTGLSGECYIDVACHPSNKDLVTVIADYFPGIMFLARTTNATGAATFNGFEPTGDTSQSIAHVRNGVMLASGEMIVNSGHHWVTADYATATNATGIAGSSFGGYVIRNSNGSILFKLHALVDVYRSTDGGRTWAKVNTSAIGGGGALKALFYDEVQDKLYVGGQGFSGTKKVHLIPNAGAAALPIPDANLFDLTLNLDAIFSTNGDEVANQGLFR